MFQRIRENVAKSPATFGCDLCLQFCSADQLSFRPDVQLMSVSVVHDPTSLLSGHTALLPLCVSTLMPPLSWCATFNLCCNVRVRAYVCTFALHASTEFDTSSSCPPGVIPVGAELYVVLFCTKHLVLLTTVVKGPHSHHEMSQRFCGNK